MWELNISTCKAVIDAVLLICVKKLIKLNEFSTMEERTQIKKYLLVATKRALIATTTIGVAIYPRTVCD